VRAEVRAALADRAGPASYLSTRAAASMAGVAEGTVRRWIREGRLTGHRAGRVLRVSADELRRLLAGPRRSDGAPTPEELARRDFG
jgi:excisionase family DNA binding protein